MNDHKNEMFLKWKQALDVGDFSKAQYFGQAYMYFTSQERGEDVKIKLLEEKTQKETALNKAIDELKKELTENQIEKLEALKDKGDMFSEIQKLETKNAELKKQLEKLIASKQAKK